MLTAGGFRSEQVNIKKSLTTNDAKHNRIFGARVFFIRLVLRRLRLIFELIKEKQISSDHLSSAHDDKKCSKILIWLPLKINRTDGVRTIIESISLLVFYSHFRNVNINTLMFQYFLNENITFSTIALCLRQYFKNFSVLKLKPNRTQVVVWEN